MNIKDVAFTFYKKILDSPNLEDILKVVKKLKSTSSKIFPAPVLGLLLYDQKKVEHYLGRNPIKELSTWEERDLKILFGIHGQILNFNRLCLAPLETGLPEAINAVNPYKQYPHAVSTEGFENLLFKPEDAEDIIKAFHTHPAFDIALSNLSAIKQRPLNYDQLIWQFNDEIVEAGPGGEPQWVKTYEETKQTDHPSVGLYRHAAALICLHNSLANLDQFIYQAIFKDEFRPLDRGHVVDYFWSMGHVGPSMWLLHISMLHMYVCEPTDLIIVNIDDPERQGGLGDTLCSIHSTTIPGTNGGPSKFTLRMIDENLNAYRYLLLQPRS